MKFRRGSALPYYRTWLSLSSYADRSLAAAAWASMPLVSDAANVDCTRC